MDLGHCPGQSGLRPGSLQLKHQDFGESVGNFTKVDEPSAIVGRGQLQSSFCPWEDTVVIEPELLIGSVGLVAQAAANYRNLPRGTFAGAERYHNGGLARYEVRAILTKDEEVLTRSDPRHRLNGGAAAGVTVVNHIDARGAEPGVEQRLRAVSNEIVQQYVKAVRAEIARGKGMSRAVGRR